MNSTIHPFFLNTLEEFIYTYCFVLPTFAIFRTILHYLEFVYYTYYLFYLNGPFILNALWVRDTISVPLFVLHIC